MTEAETQFAVATIDKAEANVRDILCHSFEHDDEHAALVVFDERCELARALTLAYRRCLPEATFVDFDSIAPTSILAGFDLLEPQDLVVLIQSTSFRLHSFRIRVELFRRSLKVIEHPHLGRMPGDEGLVYIDALAYDRDYYRGVGRALRARLEHAQVCVLDSGGEQLVFPVGFEPAKLNVGDYSEMQNIGGQFPIGEVFTESKDLEAVSGRVRIAVFGDTSFTINTPEHPITLIVERGRVVDTVASTPDFEGVLASIRADDGEVWMRELGFGLNRAFSPERTVSDVGSFERMCGVHLSLGSKHTMFNKPNIRKKAARQHVDVFVATECVKLDDEVIFKDGTWLPS